MADPRHSSLVHVFPAVPGSASGPAVVLDEPLSLWGGLDPETGMIIDQHHPQWGVGLSGSVVVMDCGRGSSSASSVLAEAVRLGTAPAAFVLRRRDEIVAVGCMVAEEIYGLVTPVVVCEADGGRGTEQIKSGDYVSIESGLLRIDLP